MNDATAKWHFYLSGWQRDGDGTVLLVRVCNQSDLTKDAEISSALQQQLIAVNTGRHDALVAALEKIAHDENTSYLACPGPPHCDKSHYPTCPVQIARAALEAVGSPLSLERGRSRDSRHGTGRPERSNNRDRETG